MTLSRFLRDYIYIPLGGNRQGEFRTYINLFTTFLLGGLWHGAGWTFIFWGTLHGLALMIHRAWKSFGFSMNKYLAWFITFNFVNFTWIFFRAKEWNDAIKVIYGLIGFNNIVLPEVFAYKLAFLNNIGIIFGKVAKNINPIDKNSISLWLLSGIVLILFFNNSMEKSRSLQFNYQSLIFSVLSFIYCIITLHNVSEFLYFNF